MMMLCCWWAACYLEDNQWPVGMGGPKSSDRTCADVIGFNKSYKTWPCGTLEGEGPGWWRCTSWISGAITTENQFRNCDRQPRLAAVVHNARVYYEMLLHFIDDWNEAVGRVEWGIKGFIFWGLAIARPRIKPRHSTRPTDSFQSSVGNFFLIPLGLRPRSNRQKSTEILATLVSPTYAGFFFILTIGDHVQWFTNEVSKSSVSDRNEE